MRYKLEFLESAKREWEKLGSTVRAQFRKKLDERLETPDVTADALHGMPGHYKIKLKQAGYRLVYRIDGGRLTVIVVAVGKRDKLAVYRRAAERR